MLFFGLAKRTVTNPIKEVIINVPIVLYFDIIGLTQKQDQKIDFRSKNFSKKKIPIEFSETVRLAASKSESNRLLLIRSLSQRKLTLGNLSEARDTQTMRKLLEERTSIWDVKDAGTTMRFLTAYLAVKGDSQTITGTARMKQRPIGLLVEALQQLGAIVEYLGKDGFPPIRISKIRKQLTKKISIPGNISSQYISALLMIAPCLPQGLEIELSSEVTSRPYIEMTLKLMARFNVRHSWKGNIIKIEQQDYSEGFYDVESDWSGASYWYSYMALNQLHGNLFLPKLNAYSTQGDQQIMELMKPMGVITEFVDGGIRIRKKEIEIYEQFIDFKDCPDLAQTVMVVAAVKGIQLTMTGLESLKIKETDRIEAMRSELTKLGAVLADHGKDWILEPSKVLPESIHISTYEDHRMAMAFAPLCHRMDVTIEDPSVVDKSYPNYWNELERLGV